MRAEAGCWFLGLLMATVLAPGLAGQHNVLVVLADDLGVDYVGCYGEGSNPPPTPTIDGIAAQGVLFRNAWAYPSCSPTRAAMLTGRHPFRTLVGRWIRHPNNSGPAIGTVREMEWTLPELLDRAGTGYGHACIGKWHMHDASFGNGAPTTLGGYATYTGALWGQIPSYTSWPRVHQGVEQTETSYATTKTTDDALAWIQGQSGPWLCYLAYNAPHIPFHAPPSGLHTRNLSSSSSNRELYKAMIEAMDTELGRLLSTLGPAVVANTHILFLGDNGSVQNMAEAPFDPSRAKGSPYEGGVNVPLIYAGPAAVSPGREVSALACAVDVFASVLELTGAAGALPSWRVTDGVSVVPYLADPQQSALRQFAFTEEFTGNAWPAPNTNGHATVRNDRYKLIHRYSGGGHELFDLVGDPWESVNLLAGALTAQQQQNYAALINRISLLRTPLAGVASFGTSCAGSHGPPAVGHVGLPRLGAGYQLTLQGAPASTFAVMASGLSHTEDQGVVLPRSLQPFGAGQGCMQWLSLDALQGAVTDVGGAAALSLSIPNTPAFMELTLLHGWFVWDSAAPQNPLGLVATGAMAAVVGL